jgi:hypothetical protein
MRVLTSRCLLLTLWHGFKDGDHRRFLFGNGSERQYRCPPSPADLDHLTSKQVYTIGHRPAMMTRMVAPQNTLGNSRMKGASPRDLVS